MYLGVNLAHSGEGVLQERLGPSDISRYSSFEWPRDPTVDSDGPTAAHRPAWSHWSIIQVSVFLNYSFTASTVSGLSSPCQRQTLKTHDHSNSYCSPVKQTPIYSRSTSSDLEGPSPYSHARLQQPTHRLKPTSTRFKCKYAAFPTCSNP